MGHLWLSGHIRRLLVVAPLSILGVWEDEFRKFADYDYSLAVLEGTGARKMDTIRHMTGLALQVLVVNYESAWRLEKELAAWRPDMIVCDVGHKIKTHNIAASKALHRLGARVPYRLLLTGTVITNKPIDVFSQYKFADSTVFGSSFYLFRNRYFDMVGYGNYTPVMKKSMEAEFTEKLHSIAFRATKAEWTGCSASRSCSGRNGTMFTMRTARPTAKKRWRRPLLAPKMSIRRAAIWAFSRPMGVICGSAARTSTR